MCVEKGSVDEESVFLSERTCFDDLVSGLTTPYSCGSGRAWKFDSITQVGNHSNILSVLHDYNYIERTSATYDVGVFTLPSKTILVEFTSDGWTLFG